MSSMTRTREEILKAIEENERWAFYLDMKDRWTTEDYRTMDRYRREIRELERELATMEAE